MCNHYQAHLEAMKAMGQWQAYAEALSAIDLATLGSDIWPKREALVIRREEGRHIAEPLRWGVPCQVPGKRPGSMLTRHVTNVRNLASPFWRSMLANPERRCLVPFSNFAEPKIGQGREEHWFSIVDQPVAAFAGLWRPSEAGNVFAFLTCEPNPLVAPLHPKAMPVILNPDDYECWLTVDGSDAARLAQPFPSQLMKAT